METNYCGKEDSHQASRPAVPTSVANTNCQRGWLFIYKHPVRCRCREVFCCLLGFATQSLKFMFNLFQAVFAIDILQITYVCPCKAISKVIWPSKFCVSTPFCMQCYIDDTALTIFFLPLPWLLQLILPAVIGKGATRRKSKRGDGMLQYYNCYTIY